MLREGIVELQTAVALSRRNPIFLSSLGYAYARSGPTDQARTILAELEALADSQYVPATAIARVYVGLDDKPAAHAWIEKAYLEHDIDLVFQAADVGLEALRSDPGFHDVFSRVGLVH